MTNILQTWENRVEHYVKKAEKNKECIGDKYSQTALAYCDCIRQFTDEQNKYEVLTRIRRRVLKLGRKPAFSE